MKGNFFLLAVLIVGLTVSCENEPFVLLPLGVTEFEDVTSRTTSTYAYKAGVLQSYRKSGPDGQITSMQFLYDRELLVSIKKDTTADGHDLIEVYGYGSAMTTDSTFHVTDTSRVLKEVRTSAYEDNRPVKIIVSSWTDTVVTRHLYELAWLNGNVSELKTSVLVEGADSLVQVVAITYDDQKGPFSSNVPYIYTMALNELYWLSTNNPVRFKRDSEADAKYIYSYNLKGYPSHIITDDQHLLACSYAELR